MSLIRVRRSVTEAAKTGRCAGRGVSWPMVRAASVPICGPGARWRWSSMTRWRHRPNDRAVHLRVHHLAGDHRPAGLRADLRLADPRQRRRPPAQDGVAVGGGRVVDPELLRLSWAADAED